jgi:putative transcriptional regulator
MTSLKGNLLVATPSLLAPIFAKSVILMLEHTDEGALGVVLNRPTEVTIASVSVQVFGRASDWQKTILLGGPVPGPLVVLHAMDDLADPERAVIPGIYTTSDAETVGAIVGLKAEPTRVVANYSGWSPGQLEGEIERGSWIALPARAEYVLGDDHPDDLWPSVTKKYHAHKLANLLHLRGVPEDPRLN